jgi:hypothetical protein
MIRNIGIAVAVALVAGLAATSGSFAATKKQDSNWRNTPIPNQSAQFYRSSKSHKSSKTKSAEPKS